MCVLGTPPQAIASSHSRNLLVNIVILAAGMGSRYGGLEQMDPVGPAGETMIDYSVFDAMRAGFGKLVFVNIIFVTNIILLNRAVNVFGFYLIIRSGRSFVITKIFLFLLRNIVFFL